MINKIYAKLRLLKRGWFLKAAGIVYPASVRIQTPRQTLDEIRRVISARMPGAYLRFGDGEVNILHGLGSMEQNSNAAMSKEMKQSFCLTGPGIIKSLMIHSDRFGKSEGMGPGTHWNTDEWAERLLSRCFEYFIGEKIYSHAALAYAAVYDQKYALDFLKFLKSLNPIFVGNGQYQPQLLERLFGKTVFIPTPPKDAYLNINQIENQTVQAIKQRARPFDVVVMALGPTSNILQMRLITKHRLPVFLFDYGSLLSAFAGNISRVWMAPEGVSQINWEELLLNV